ncbi:MAG: VTT domain-containing protein [Carboxydocellales bacterium]
MKYKFSEKHGLAVTLVVILLILLGWKLFSGELLRLRALKTELPHLVSFIRSFPVGAPLVIFGLGFLQGAIPIIPYFLLAGAAGILYGMFMGLLIIWSAGVLGACATFGIARYLGKEFVQRWLLKRGWDFCYTNEKGFLAICGCRLIPVVPSVAVSIISGISKVRFSDFASATAIGKLPWAFLYTTLGYNLSRGKTWAIYLAFALVAAMFTYIVYRGFVNRTPVKSKH